MNRIDLKFKELRARKQKALIPFVTAGYPDLESTEKIVLAMEAAGADLIELGIPFSDPIADGPVIQMSSFAALKKKTTLKKVLQMIRRLRQKTRIPLLAMTYFNPVLQYGPARFVRDALACGLDGVIIPDLPSEEEKEFAALARRQGLAVVLFIAPTTSEKRMRKIARLSRGFIYFVSLAGVTGARRDLPPGLKERLRAARSAAGKKPVCVGFGVSNARQIKDLSAHCDGVIVGSAIVRKIQEGLSRRDYVRRVGAFLKSLRAAR